MTEWVWPLFFVCLCAYVQSAADPREAADPSEPDQHGGLRGSALWQGPAEGSLWVPSLPLTPLPSLPRPAPKLLHFLFHPQRGHCCRLFLDLWLKTHQTKSPLEASSSAVHFDLPTGFKRKNKWNSTCWVRWLLKKQLTGVAGLLVFIDLSTRKSSIKKETFRQNIVHKSKLQWCIKELENNVVKVNPSGSDWYSEQVNWMNSCALLIRRSQFSESVPLSHFVNSGCDSLLSFYLIWLKFHYM